MTDTRVARQITDRMEAMADEAEARHLMRFFKTAKGEYGEGDRFLGIRVPQTRAIVKEMRGNATIDDAERLTESPYHEIRLAGFLLMIEIYNRARKSGHGRQVVDLYLRLLDRGNNWDLVDLVAPKILGEHLMTHRDERQILDRLAAMEGRLWHQRVAIVATFALIRAGEYDDTIRISRTLMNRPHDLIHKATGWMLREMGKRGGHDRLIEFLDRHAAEMPRTTLRYAIERLPEATRRHYLALPR